MTVTTPDGRWHEAEAHSEARVGAQVIKANAAHGWRGRRAGEAIGQAFVDALNEVMIGMAAAAERAATELNNHIRAIRRAAFAEQRAVVDRLLELPWWHDLRLRWRLRAAPRWTEYPWAGER